MQIAVENHEFSATQIPHMAETENYPDADDGLRCVYNILLSFQ